MPEIVPSEPPLVALRYHACLDSRRTQVVLAGYACGTRGSSLRSVSGEHPVFIAKLHAMAATAPATADEFEACCKAVSPDSSGTMKAGGFDKINWLKILQTLLPLLLGLL